MAQSTNWLLFHRLPSKDVSMSLPPKARSSEPVAPSDGSSLKSPKTNQALLWR